MRVINASSGAYGIPQALGHGHVFDLGDARAQIAWGLNYIREPANRTSGRPSPVRIRHLADLHRAHQRRLQRTTSADHHRPDARSQQRERGQVTQVIIAIIAAAYIATGIITLITSRRYIDNVIADLIKIGTWRPAKWIIVTYAYTILLWPLIAAAGVAAAWISREARRTK